MDNQFFERPILNSPYEPPDRHWELDAQGQPTQKIVETRRRAEFITPIPKPRKQKQKQDSLVFDEGKGLSTQKQLYDPTPIINELHYQVDQWRKLSNPSDWLVTPETATLLQHWRQFKFNNVRPFFCQVEAEKCRDARGTRWLEDLFQDLRYALRTLRQRPSFAAVAVLTLALGSGATTVMFTVINDVLLKPLAYPEADRLVTLHGKTEKYGEQWGFSYPEFRDYQSASRALESVAAWTYGGGTVTKPGEADYVFGRLISSGLFSALGVPLVEGRAFLPQEDQPGAAPVAVISYGLWQRRFGGNKETIGQRLVFEGKPYSIVGIAPRNHR